MKRPGIVSCDAIPWAVVGAMAFFSFICLFLPAFIHVTSGMWRMALGM